MNFTVSPYSIIQYYDNTRLLDSQATRFEDGDEDAARDETDEDECSTNSSGCQEATETRTTRVRKTFFNERSPHRQLG